MRIAPTQLTELPGEDLDTRTIAEAASWITSYEELATVLRSILAHSEDGARPPDLEANLSWIEERLRRWRARHAELAGIVVDPEAHTCSYAGNTVMLTKRETDLLSYLLVHPHRAFSPRQLALAAWN